MDRFQECKAQGLIGIPRKELVQYLFKAAEVIDDLNQNLNTIHCDVKPQNILYRNGEIQLLKSAFAVKMGEMIATVSNGCTWQYAAPEHFDGLVSRSSDQYSLAVVYQEMLTSDRPYQGTNPHELIEQIISNRTKLASLPPFDQKVVARAISKSPDERFSTCKDFVNALSSE